jgi:tRNA modification GTPase
MAMMGGGLSRRIGGWTTSLRKLAAQVEARIDFSDEGDVEESGAIEGLADACVEIAAAMESDLAKPGAERLKDGIRVAIGGPPNAGKSTLFNALVGRDAAIVSPHAGTTRDVIEATIAIRGVPFLLSDSAGLRDAQDDVERMGVDRAEALLAQADIVLWLGAADVKPLVHGELIQLRAKADVNSSGQGLAISARTGQGISDLVDRLCIVAESLLPVPGDYALSQRQRRVLLRSAAAVRDAAAERDEILVAENLRQALTALDELTGHVTTDAVLDELFSGFCIGK